MTESVKLRRYQGAVWDEPVVMTLSHPGRRGVLFPRTDIPADLSAIPQAMRRSIPPELPEMSEPDVLRHYLHLSQQTLGMMGISLFGTCTMKYNARINEAITARDEVVQLHPRQPDTTLQGSLQIMHDLDLNLRALSGMDRFVFQAAGGADAAFLHVCVTRAYHAARGELDTRDEIITSIQSHPCNPATAATAGFKIVTLPLGPNGYPSLESLKAAVSTRTAALMINNPDDMGIYNPDITEWVKIVKAAGGLCFYDHANFNGVMSKIRARDLGFDACMFMLHKTFGAPKGGGGPAVGAYGCSEELIPYLPGPLLVEDKGEFRLQPGNEVGVGRVREFFGNLPQMIKAYAWVRAMGIEGIAEASDLSVLANNYMGQKLSQIRGVTCSHPHIKAWRLEMTRYSLEVLEQETGVSAYDVQNRMVDYGVDAFWLAHEPWIIPQPFTPEAGEMWSKEDIDYWITVLAKVCQEAYDDPELVRTAPHNHVIGRLDTGPLEDPARWATTWRAYQRKHAQP